MQNAPEAVVEKKAAARLPNGPPLRRGIVENARFFASFYFDPLGFIEQRFATYGDVYFVPDAKQGLFVFRHPDHLRELLSTQASKFRKEHSAFDRLSLVLGEGLLTTDGDVWKRQRRLVQPGFTKTKLAEYSSVFVEESLKTTRELDGAAGAGKERDMGQVLMELTLRAVCRTLFGHDAASDAETVGRAMQSLQKTLSRPEQIPDWLPIPGAGGSPKKAIASLDAVVYGLIRARREELSRGAHPSGNLLDALLTAIDAEGNGDGLTEKEIRDQLMTLFLAGHETTSHALTWTLYLLSQNPAAREAVIAETRSVLGDRPATMDDLARLPLSLQAIKEALRLFPPAYLLARRASEDVEIAGYRMAKGTEAIAWIYMTQRDPRWFDDPTAFRLERFTEANERAMHPFAFVPFGAGPRACIGKAFAMLEAHLMLVTLVQRFRFSLAPRQVVVPQPRITMHPKNGLRMRLERL